MSPRRENQTEYDMETVIIYRGLHGDLHDFFAGQGAGMKSPTKDPKPAFFPGLAVGQTSEIQVNGFTEGHINRASVVLLSLLTRTGISSGSKCWKLHPEAHISQSSSWSPHFEKPHMTLAKPGVARSHLCLPPWGFTSLRVYM